MGFLGVIAFILALLISVMVHEFGHYITAKRYGMRVTEFFVGFGKRLWSTQRGETEFGIKAIPAGGYCKISGMSPNEELADEFKPRAFYLATAPKKLVVLSAGSFLHFVFAILLLFALFAGIGTSQVLPTISQVLPCVPKESQCQPGDPISPAKRFGLMPGDEILGVNGQVLPWGDAAEILRASAEREINFIIKRDGQIMNIAITPATRIVDGSPRGFLGVINEIGLVRQSPIKAISSSIRATGAIFEGSIKALMSLPSQVPSLVGQTFLGQERNSQGLVGIIGVARASGETVSSGNLSTGEKVATFILIVASLNIFVGIFNLLPILPLDGGHIAVASYEAIRRRIAAIRGKADPGPVDVERLTPITLVVFAILLALTLLLLIADVFNPINLDL
ncbi:MAG: site-2 protease family protein [Actinobacteria bacterium]|nr:site-2 protease family protein [Actinomycetota bacterium]